MTTNDFGEDENCPSITLRVAGLQFYSYFADDDLIGTVRPAKGDRLQLIRNTSNEYDENAVEIWYRDSQFMLGHIPRLHAQFVAKDLDDGKNIRAYAVSADGGDWSLKIKLFHEELNEELKLISLE